jgi:endonuclease YncB( thermonuclease family)
MHRLRRFSRPPRNRRQFRGRPLPTRPYRRKRFGLVEAVVIAIAMAIGGLTGIASIPTRDAKAEPEAFPCATTAVLDGDTFDCDGQRIRLQGIDAPELPGHCRPGRDCTPGDPYASTRNLRRLVSWRDVTCRKVDTDHYGRTVARCSAGKADLSCAQLDGGYAVRRYGMIWC